ncbi:hypothetical protein, partial [Facilibium subflavum]|uniref:hypothetical protein n=1 Tax=Facilibium subflavum TaxID=2219058 RepID=UPI0013C2B6C0
MNIKKALCYLFLSMYLSVSFAEIKGVWGNINMINDFGKTSQPSVAGFAVSNNSPYTVEYLGTSSDEIVTFEGDIAPNTPMLENPEDIFKNRFYSKDRDVPEAQAFFRICPSDYHKCLYFKLASHHRSYGFYGYTGNKAAGEHEKDLENYRDSLTGNSIWGIAVTGAGGVAGVISSYYLIRHLRKSANISKMIENTQKKISAANQQISKLSNQFDSGARSLIKELQIVDKKYVSALSKQMKLGIERHAKVTQLNEIKAKLSKVVNTNNLEEIHKLSRARTAAYNEVSKVAIKQQQAMIEASTYSKKIDNLNSSIKQASKLDAKWNAKVEKALTNKVNDLQLAQNKLANLQAQKLKLLGAKQLLKDIGSTIMVMAIPIAMAYVGLLISTRGTHQGVWGTGFLAYALEPVTQDDVNKYDFLPDEALQTDFDLIDQNTAFETIRLSFDGDDIDNQVLIEISLSVLSSVWNKQLIREAEGDDWGDDLFRGVLREEARWGVPEVEWKQSGALLLSIKSFNDLDYITQYVDMTTAIKEHNPESQASSLMIFDAP